jgi:hypothetical protein
MGGGLLESRYMQIPWNIQDWSSFMMFRITGVSFDITTELPYVVPNYSELK